jgi:poly-gamma-glutamate synthesis protein (capsule biosynthesis protein)
VYEAEAGSITMALSGDTLLNRALTPFREPSFLRLRDLLHSADVRFTNGETLFHNYENAPGYLYGMYTRCDPRLLTDLQWIGVNLMSCANNHAFDFGERGLLTNIRNLQDAGLANSGTGENYARAVAPAYLDTPNGRVALVSATSTAPSNSRAGEQRRDMEGRPGANVVRWTNEWTLDGPAFREFKRAADHFGWNQRPWPWWTRAYGDATGADVVQFMDRNVLESVGVFTEDPAARFVLGEDFERHTRLHRADLARNVASVAEARRMADWVLFSIHNHEGGNNLDEPSEHIQRLAHAVIDAGADIVIGHGPHRDRGIEIYNGKPIIYSLGAFIDQWETMSPMPQDVMLHMGLGHEESTADMLDTFLAGRPQPNPNPQLWSAVPVVTFNAKRVCDIKLYPITLGPGTPRSQAGRPLLAEGEFARLALERFRTLSAPFATDVKIEGSLGVIRVG